MKPTILIPGITGTKLADTNKPDFDIIWSGIQSKYETIYDLKLDIGTKFDKSDEVIIGHADVEDIAYKEAYYIIKRKLGGKVFIFGYDWRRSCVENGKRLKAFVDYLSAKLSETSFNFLTHSMGGIVFTCFLKTLRGDYTSRSKVFNDIQNSPQIAQAGYDLINARVSWASQSNDWEVALFGTNLGDEEYLEHGFFAAAFGAAVGVAGRPREWGAGARYRF